MITPIFVSCYVRVGEGFVYLLMMAFVFCSVPMDFVVVILFFYVLISSNDAFSFCDNLNLITFMCTSVCCCSCHSLKPFCSFGDLDSCLIVFSEVICTVYIVCSHLLIIVTCVCITS